jgi:CRP-like cAMP-binding protein
MMNDGGLLVRRLARVMPLEAEEIKGITALETHSRRVAPRTELIHEHDAVCRFFILEKGWAFSYKLLPDGGRQVIDFSIPGDIVGLRSLFLNVSHYTFTTITDVTVVELSWQQIEDVFRRLPRLGAAILWATSRHEAMMVEHLVNIGRRSALIRTAHFLLELRDRLELVGLAQPAGFACPLNQYLLADALGLSAIHLNRVLRHLREQKLVTFRDGTVIFHDVARLRQLAGYHAGYLALADDPSTNARPPRGRPQTAAANPDGALVGFGVVGPRVSMGGLSG